jgi:hypothetical protein
VIAIIPTAESSKGNRQSAGRVRGDDARILPEMGVRVSFLDRRRFDHA